MTDELSDKIIELIKESMVIPSEIGKITLTTKFKEELDMDSLEFYELIYNIEEEYNINLPNKSYLNWNSVQEVMDMIRPNKDFIF